MNDEQYEKAQGIKAKIRAVEKELMIWEERLTSPSRLGYETTHGSYPNRHFMELETTVPKEIFDGFRMAAISSLKIQISELRAEFVEI